MSTSFKIRSLLFLLTLSFIVTAITINKTFNEEKILELDAKTLEKNLHVKEKIATDFLNSTQNFQNLQDIEHNEKFTLKVLEEFVRKHNIHIYTFKNKRVSFWSTNSYVPSSDGNFMEGDNFIKRDNGWYLVIKRSSGRFSALCVIPIKTQYQLQNKFLRNTFSTDLVSHNNIDIATIKDPFVYNIRSQDNKYLFSVKLKSSPTHTFYSKIELWMWLLSMLFGGIFMTLTAAWIASKKHVKTAIGFLLLYFFTIGLLNFKIQWFNRHFFISIFDSSYFSENAFFPTIFDFLLSLIATTWILVFIYYYRNKIELPKLLVRRPASFIVFGIIGIIVGIIAFVTNFLFKDLITHSSINFNLTNILNLTRFSWIGILLLCLSVFNLFLTIEIAIGIGKRLNLTWKQRLIIFLSGIFILFAYMLFIKKIDIAFLLFALIVFVRGGVVYYLRNDDQYNLAVFVFTILAFSIISSIKLSDFQTIKERQQQEIFAKRLESPNDPNSIILFKKLENHIIKDRFILNYFQSPNKRKYQLIDKLDKSYLEGYLNKYEFEVYSYAADGSIYNADSVSLNHFKDLVISRSIKVSNYFYRINDSFAYQNYFAILPIADTVRPLGTLVLHLRSKTFQESNFPEVLNTGTLDQDRELKKNAFAFYQDGQLLYQNGPYIYNLKNSNLNGKINEFVFKEDDGYRHLIYQSNSRKMIVVSRPLKTWIDQLASTSFLFLVLIIFTVFMILVFWLAINFRDHEFKFHLYNWSSIISQNRILYRTRIQASLVAAIISTLLIVGIVTYLSISKQFRHQRQSDILHQINLMADGFEKKMFENGRMVYDEQTLREFATVNASDLNLYNTNGGLIFSTQPKIYDYALIARRMDALPYIYLSKYQRSEYVDTEYIGSLAFLTAYKPIRNNNNVTVAYISLPYYQYKKEIGEQIGSFLDTLINVYALVLVTIGLFAFFVANRITYPLMLVQRSLAAIQIGSKNEPISWKRNDEIGSLIKEYNNMIIALEESALKLARSERESAWREMAKQVAHEIKNPLTPLKLGVQLLEKSWREKDPNFEKKFEKFSKSFIEQIESLSHIASEFSNFAKMPVTTYENVHLQDVIERSIEIYNKLNDLNITLEDHSGIDLIIKGDKDQLLRLFNNLIKNAIEAIPDYREGNITIILEKKDKQALIQVKDNGKGIPEALRDRIFHPNFTTKSSGTGLGLAFIKQATENMMGNIYYETEPDKGTTFFITIPIAV